jgi:hypothetical protein
MTSIPLVEIVVGAGIVGMLWKMSHQLGSLTEQLKRFSDMISDHETRIRHIEKQEKG